MASIISQRQFLLRDSEGRNVDVVAKLYSLRNQAPYFSVTSQNGAAHEQILSAAPEEVRSDLMKLIALHLRDENGVPMHAVENTAYHLENARFRDAKDTLPGSRIEDMYRLHDEAGQTAQPMATLLQQLKTAAAKVLSTQAEMEREAKERNSLFNRHEDRFLDALDHYLAVRNLKKVAPKAEDAPRRPKTERLKEASKVLAKGTLDELTAFASGRPGDKQVEALRKRLVSKRIKDAVASYVQTTCLPRWRVEVIIARELLAKGDYLAPGRPEPANDITTWGGFAASVGLTISTQNRGRATSGQFAGSTKYTVTLARNGGVFEFPFFLGSAHTSPPDLGMVLETMQSDIGSIWGRDRDEWISDLGFDGDIKSVRSGEESFAAISSNRDELRSLLGEDGFRQLMTSVGDNPPLRIEDFEQPTASPGV